MKKRYLYTFGAGNDGRLGHGNCVDQYFPTYVVPPWEHSETHSSGAKRMHSDSKWEENLSVQKNWSMKMVACGDKHTICITSSGAAYSFGFGGDGRLGLGNEKTQYKPRRIISCDALNVTRRNSKKRSTVTLNIHEKSIHEEKIKMTTIVTHAACGFRHSGVVTSEGLLFTFGRNNYGQLEYCLRYKKRMPKLM